jgi:hypothetical protein
LACIFLAAAQAESDLPILSVFLDESNVKN